MTAGAEEISRRQFWLDAAIIFIVACAVFSPVVPGGFSPLDDFEMLRDNPRYQQPTLGTFLDHFRDPEFRIFAPLTYWVWHVLASLFGVTDPLPYKLASLVAHGSASVAAWWAVGLIVRDRWAALAGGLLVATHPLQVEAVGWTTGLKDVLCAGLMFATIGAYVRYLQTRKRRGWRIALVLAILASLAKPTAMVLPLMLLAIDWWNNGDWSWRLAFRRLWAFCVPAGALALIMLRVQGDANVPHIDLAIRPLVALDALAFYLGKLVFPAWLIPDYGRSPTYVMKVGQLYWTWIVPLGLAVVIIRYVPRTVQLGAALALIPLLPLLGLVPFDMQQYSTTADHYVYPCMAGVGIALATLVQRWRGTGAVLIPIALLGVLQASYWRDMEALWKRSAEINPRSSLAYGLLANLASQRNDLEAAEHWGRKSVDAERRPIALSNLSAVLHRRGKKDESLALAREAFDKGLVDPGAIRIILRQAVADGDQALADRARGMLKHMEALESHQRTRLLPVDK